MQGPGLLCWLVLATSARSSIRGPWTTLRASRLQPTPQQPGFEWSAHNPLQVLLRRVCNVLLPTRLQHNSLEVFGFFYVPEPVPCKWNGLFFEFQRPLPHELAAEVSELVSKNNFGKVRDDVKRALDEHKRITEFAKSAAGEREESKGAELLQSLPDATRFLVCKRIVDAETYLKAPGSPKAAVLPSARRMLGDLAPRFAPRDDDDEEAEEAEEAEGGEVEVGMFRFVTDTRQLREAEARRGSLLLSRARDETQEEQEEQGQGQRQWQGQEQGQSSLLLDADLVAALQDAQVTETEDRIVIRKVVTDEEWARLGLDNSPSPSPADPEEGSRREAEEAEEGVGGIGPEQGRARVVSLEEARSMTPSQLRRLKGQLRREQERECIEAMLAFSRLPHEIDTGAGAEAEAGAEKGTSEALVASHSPPVPLLDAAYDRVAGACDKVVSLLLHPAYSYRCLCFMLIFARLGSSRDRSWDSLQAASKGVITVLPPLVAASWALGRVAKAVLTLQRRAQIASARGTAMLATLACGLWVLLESASGWGLAPPRHFAVKAALPAR